MHDTSKVEESLIPQSLLDGIKEIERSYPDTHVILPTSKQIIFSRIAVQLALLDQMKSEDATKVIRIRSARKMLRMFCKGRGVNA